MSPLAVRRSRKRAVKKKQPLGAAAIKPGARSAVRIFHQRANALLLHEPIGFVLTVQHSCHFLIGARPVYTFSSVEGVPIGISLCVQESSGRCFSPRMGLIVLRRVCE